ncbi:MAG: hypothetical protein V1846_05335 [Candidatus Komeilibacteria bacterium]
MFDHLDPRPVLQKNWHHHISLSFLLASCLMLVLAFTAPIISFTQTERPAGDPVVRVWVDTDAAKQSEVVGPVENLEVAHLVMQSDDPVTLYRLRLIIDGLYLPTDLTLPRLYVDEVQVGHDRKVNNDGVITFETKTAVLTAGTHDIVVRANWLVNGPGHLLTARLESAKDIIFTAPGSNPTVQAVFPLSTGGISFVSAGSWVMVQPTDLAPQAASDDHDLQRVAFSLPLAARAEAITVSKIVLGFETKKFIPVSVSILKDSTAVKVWNNIVIANDQYVWDVPGSDLVISPDKISQLQVIVRGKAESDQAQVSLSTRQVEGTGFSSGSKITWQPVDPLVQDRQLVHDQPAWTLESPDSLTGYRLRLQTLSHAGIVLSSLVLQLTAEVATGSLPWKVYLQGKEVPAEFTWSKPDLIRVNFQPKITVQNKDTLEFRATADSTGKNQAAVRLLPTEFIWETKSTDWFAVAGLLLPTAPAGMINF